jgi:predicted house-cleaning noncanonical NTP pyrophosphatase (MazG superfamily)
MNKDYFKLVRDNIPLLIEKQGKKAVTRTLPDREFHEKLCAKLREETEEYIADNTVEELADILEVMCTLLEYHGLDFAELEKIREEKRAERGGFSDRIFLERVIDYLE